MLAVPVRDVVDTVWVQRRRDDDDGMFPSGFPRLCVRCGQHPSELHRHFGRRRFAGVHRRGDEDDHLAVVDRGAFFGMGRPARVGDPL